MLPQMSHVVEKLLAGVLSASLLGSAALSVAQATAAPASPYSSLQSTAIAVLLTVCTGLIGLAYRDIARQFKDAKGMTVTLGEDIRRKLNQMSSQFEMHQRQHQEYVRAIMKLETQLHPDQAEIIMEAMSDLMVDKRHITNGGM